jgi:hypothetical protein
LLLHAKALLKFLEEEPSNGVDEVFAQPTEVRQFQAACLPAYGRRFGMTKKKRLCILPECTQSGDFVVVPVKSKVPFILRKRTKGYGNVGEAYIHGIMNGELSKEFEKNIETIVIF